LTADAARLSDQLSSASERVESLQKDKAGLEAELGEKTQRGRLEAEARALQQVQLHEEQSARLEAALKEKAALHDKLALLKRKHESVLKDLRAEMSAKAEQVAGAEETVRCVEWQGLALSAAGSDTAGRRAGAHHRRLEGRPGAGRQAPPQRAGRGRCPPRRAAAVSA